MVNLNIILMLQTANLSLVFDYVCIPCGYLKNATLSTLDPTNSLNFTVTAIQ